MDLGNHDQPNNKSGRGENTALKLGLTILGVLFGVMILFNAFQLFKGKAKVVAIKTEWAANNITLEDLHSQYPRLDSLQQIFPAKEEEIEQLKQQLNQHRAIIADNIQSEAQKIEVLTGMNHTLGAQVVIGILLLALSIGLWFFLIRRK